MTPDQRIDAIRRALDKAPEPARSLLLQSLEEGERERQRALLEDMGYDDCGVCRAARLRTAFAPDGKA